MVGPSFLESPRVVTLEDLFTPIESCYLTPEVMIFPSYVEKIVFYFLLRLMSYKEAVSSLYAILALINRTGWDSSAFSFVEVKSQCLLNL